MFGEHQSDTALRCPSPWDAFLSSPPAHEVELGQPPDIAKYLSNSIPKIEPENDDGNAHIPFSQSHFRLTPSHSDSYASYEFQMAT